MANDLTGDFDVVAEFTLPAANRVLAAMHSGNSIFGAGTSQTNFTGPGGGFSPNRTPANANGNNCGRSDGKCR